MSVNLNKQWFPQLLTSLDRAPMAGLFCAVAILFGVTLAWTRSAAAPHNSRLANEEALSGRTKDSGEQAPGYDKSSNLIEGGEIINQAGHFRASGERFAFIAADNQQHFIALENSHLERVAQIVVKNRNPSEWIVSGKISKYRGANFLLISRAELKSPVTLSYSGR